MIVEQRALIAIAVVIVIVIVIVVNNAQRRSEALAQSAQEFSSQSSQQPVLECADPDTRDLLRNLLTRGLDKAFEERLTHLFEIWMKDTQGQPQRFLNGGRITLRGYLSARDFVASWNPPPCNPKLLEEWKKSSPPKPQ